MASASSSLNSDTSSGVFLQGMEAAQKMVIKDWIIQFALVPPPLRAAYLAFVALRLSGHKQRPVAIERKKSTKTYYSVTVFDNMSI